MAIVLPSLKAALTTPLVLLFKFTVLLLDLAISLVYNIFLTTLVVFLILSLPLAFAVVIGSEVIIKYLGYKDRLKFKLSEHNTEKRTYHTKQVIKKYLQVECTRQSEIAPHLVNAYLHLSNDTVYEVEKRSKTITRIFKFNNKKNKIEVRSFGGFRNNSSVNLVSDLDYDDRAYFNFLPEGVAMPEVKTS